MQNLPFSHVKRPGLFLIQFKQLSYKQSKISLPLRECRSFKEEWSLKISTGPKTMPKFREHSAFTESAKGKMYFLTKRLEYGIVRRWWQGQESISQTEKALWLQKTKQETPYNLHRVPFWVPYCQGGSGRKGSVAIARWFSTESGLQSTEFREQGDTKKNILVRSKGPHAPQGVHMHLKGFACT